MSRYRIRKTEDGEDIYTIRREGELIYWLPLLLSTIFILIPFLLESQKEMAQTEKSIEQLEIANDVWNGGTATTQDGKPLDLGAVLNCISILQESGLSRTDIETAIIDEHNVLHPQCR
ncbi:MAG: hypothetical protein WA947_05720 [Phormidesmis sp.]